MQKLIIQILLLFPTYVLQAQTSTDILGVYHYKHQGIRSIMELKADSFVYRSASTLPQSEVKGVWERRNNQLFLQSDLQLSHDLWVKERQGRKDSIKITFKDARGIGLGKAIMILNNTEANSYVLDSLGKIQIKNDFEIKNITIQYLSYPDIHYKVKHSLFCEFEFIFTPSASVLYRYFDAESWEIDKNILLDKTDGLVRKYRKRKK